jgi:hypothetical protein
VSSTENILQAVPNPKFWRNREAEILKFEALWLLQTSCTPTSLFLSPPLRPPLPNVLEPARPSPQLGSQLE